MAPSGDSNLFAEHVPSLREVRFLGFGEYDAGRELRYGRGTRAALVRAGFRGDMHWEEVSKAVARYSGFGLKKYKGALKLPDLRPSDPEFLRAWSANFDGRPPWVDEEVFRRGFIGDSPSTTEELLGHAVFYGVLAQTGLREAAEVVFAFPGLAKDQHVDISSVPEVSVDERDLEMLKNRIGRTSSYSDKRFGGIGQQELVRRQWSILELKAAAQGVTASMSEVFERLSKFGFLGVALPKCGPEVIEEYEFNELELAILTSKDRSVGSFSRFGGFHDDDRKPIIGPIPAYHMMTVSQEEKVSLGQVSEALDGMSKLGVARAAPILPSELSTYIPTAGEVGLARHLRSTSLGYEVAAASFRRRASIGYICDLVAPWLSWLTGADAELPLERLRTGAGTLVPTYSELSFLAAAAPLARSNGGVVDGYVACLLAAQANSSLATAAEFSRRLQAIMEVDSLVVQFGEIESFGWEQNVPDSRWVLAVDDSALSRGAKLPMRSHLGLDSAFVREVRRILRA